MRCSPSYPASTTRSSGAFAIDGPWVLAGLALGFQVHARDEIVVQQERQDVIAVDPLVRRRVDLDAVMEIEQRCNRSRNQTSESNGDNRARASMRAGTRVPAARYEGPLHPSTCTGISSRDSTSSATRALTSAGPNRK